MTDQPFARATTGDPVGTTIGGRYKLIRLIATGGMARVYQAMDEVLVRPVAVKILHNHLLSDDAFVERFRHEAIAAARLSHPSIVSIYDTVSDNGLEAIVMELVHGTTLRRRLDVVKVLPIDQTIAIGAQVADALDTAHAAKVVHRDIKPANILLSTDGRVMVADFGIAKASESGDLTAQGSMLGTAKYLAPEQVEGTPVDGRTDVYALGIVLYESLCGRVPFLADTDTGTALSRLHHAPMRPRQVRAEIPRQIEEVIMRAMARHPADRFADAAQFRAALLGCIDGRPTIDVPVDDTAELDSQTTTMARDRTPVPPSGQPIGSDEGDVDLEVGFSRSERAWLVPTLLILLVAIALAMIGILFGTSNTGHRLLDLSSPSSATTVIGPPEITAVHAFDPPPGDGSEDNAQLRNLIDGNPDTSWHTDTYYDAPKFGVKSGVGVVLTLDQPTDLASLIVDSSSSGWSASIYVTNGLPPDTLADWGKPVTSRSAIAAGSTTFALHGRRSTHVLLWITSLSADGRVEISGLQLR